MSYVDKIKKGNKIFDIQDARIPDPSTLGLEVIEWDTIRSFTDEEIEKLVKLKACISVEDSGEYDIFYVTQIYKYENKYEILLNFVRVFDDGIRNGNINSIMIYLEDENYVGNIYSNAFEDLVDTKLYRHRIHYKEGATDKADIIIVNNSVTLFTKDTLVETINNMAYISMYAKRTVDDNYGAVSYAYVEDVNLHIWYFSDNDERIIDIYSDTSEVVITDTVTQL